MYRYDVNDIVLYKHLYAIHHFLYCATKSHTIGNFLHHLTTHEQCHQKGNLMHAVFVPIGQIKQDQWENIGILIKIKQKTNYQI